MADESEAPPLPQPQRIIVYKKRKVKHEHHGGAWKVAFADFMTAMFALFLVLWILTQSQEVKSAVATYFRHASDYEGKPDEIWRGNKGLMENKQGRLDNPNNALGNEEQSNGSKADPQSASGGLSKAAPEPALRPQTVERIDSEVDEVRTFLDLQDQIWKRLGNDPSFSKVKDNLVIEAHEEGLLIQLVQQAQSPLFDQKTGAFKDAMRGIFAELGKTLGTLPNKLEIDGHGSIFENSANAGQKWAVSAQMADLARAELEKNGVRNGQVTKVAGCGTARMLNPNNVNDPINQRISIFIRPRQWRVERY